MAGSPDDRLLVRGHATVLGVAATTRHVYAVTHSGLVVFDRVFSRWDPPSARALAELEDAGVTTITRPVLAADPVEDAVWLGLPGAVVIYRAAGQQVVRVPVVGQPEVIAFSPDDPGHGYVRASGRWTRVSRAGFTQPAVGRTTPTLRPPVALGDVYREHPALRGQLPFALRSALHDQGSGAAATALGRLPAVSVTSGTLAPDRPSEVWLGTRAHGVWQYEVNAAIATWHPFGLTSGSASRLARGGEGVWAVGETAPGGALGGSGLTFLSDDLQRYLWPEWPRTVPRGGARVLALAIREAQAWIGTDQGLTQASFDGSGVVREWGEIDGLSSPVVYAIAPADEGAWVGTARGLQFVEASGETRRSVAGAAYPGVPVYALERFGDELLVATATGVTLQSVLPPASTPGEGQGAAAFPSQVGGRPLVTPDGRRVPPATVLARHDSLLLVASDRTLAMYVLPANALDASGAVRTAPLMVTPLSHTPVALQNAAWLGPIVAARIDERAVWIAGRDGVLAWSHRGTAPRRLDVGRELSGPIGDLVLDAEWAWTATAAGVVRIRRARDGGLP